MTSYELDTVESRFGSAYIEEQQLPEGDEQAGTVVVRWEHGFFGKLRYRLWANLVPRVAQVPSVLIKSVVFTPNPVPLGSRWAVRVGIVNCGNVHIGATSEEPRAGEFILAVPSLRNANGDLISLSRLGMAPGLYQHEIDIDLESGEEAFFDWTLDEVPNTDVTRGLVGVYTTQVELQDRLLWYFRDLSTLSELVELEFVV